MAMHIIIKYVVANSDMTYLLITIKYMSYLSSKQHDNFYY